MGEPQQNDRVPVKEQGQLSPPVVGRPIYECARAVHVEGFVPHALVRVWANSTEQLAAQRPVVGFGDFALNRPLNVGDEITATQEAFGFVSAHSYVPVVVEHQLPTLPRPTVGEEIYECGRVVVVSSLTASTHVEVYAAPVDPPPLDAAHLIGTAEATGPSVAVVTSSLVAGHHVVARQVSCPGTAHEVASQKSASEPVLAEPRPLHKPVLDPVIPGNDTVTLEQLYVGALIDVRDMTAGASIGNGLANAHANWSHVSPRIDGAHEYRASQKLCDPSPLSDPAPVQKELAAPVLVSDVCPGDRSVRIQATTMNAAVVLMRGGLVIGVGGAVPGELELAVGPSFTINVGDELHARQFIGNLLSGDSNHVYVIDCQDVVTQHNDKWRRGATLRETTLTPAGIRPPSGFGRLYERHVNGDQLAQILYVRNVPATTQGTKNLFFAATSTNEVYAFDADNHDPNPDAAVVWKTEPLGPTRLLNDAEICRETLGSVGITSTPVIDVQSQTMYVVARHWNGGVPSAPGQTDLTGDNFLHALSLADGSQRMPARKIEGTDPRTEQRFDPTVQRNRPGLLLLNGVVYIGFATFSCDAGEYHGWVFGYAANDLHPVAIFCTTKTIDNNRWGAGIWQSGNGLVGSDDGHVYFATGNDIFDPRDDPNLKAHPLASPELADALVRLRAIPAWPGLELAAHFQPSNAQRLRDGDRDANYVAIEGPPGWSHWGDTDLGSGGPFLLPGNRLIGGGKQGRYYVLDSTTMHLTQDQTSPDPAKIGQGFQAFWNTYHLPPALDAFTEADLGAAEGFGPNIHGGPVYWRDQGLIYQMPEKDYLKAYRYDAATGVLHHAGGPARTATVRPPNGMPGGHSSLSANRDRDGIVWTIFPTADGQWGSVTGTIHAFDALNLTEVWADTATPERFAKFNPPTIADGKVFRPVFAQYQYNDTNQGGQNAAPTRIGPGKVVVYGFPHRHVQPQPAFRPLPYQQGDPAPRWTLTEFVERHRGAGVLALPAGGEVEIGDQRGGKRHDFTGMLSSRHQQVSAPNRPDADDPTCHKPPTHPVSVASAVFWSETTGAHVVMGEILEEYLRHDGPTGELGYPIASETDTPDHRGRIGRFEHGSISWYPESGPRLERMD